MIENIIEVTIGVLCGSLATYVIVKKLFNPYEIAENLMDFIVSDGEMQKKVFILGALLGNGIKSGIGLNPKGGKFKFEDLITNVLANFFLKGKSEGETGEPLQNFLERLRGEKTA